MQFKNYEKQIKKMNDEREKRCVPIAEFLLKSFVKHNIGLTVSDFNDVMKAYQPVYDDMVAEGIKNNWMVNDIIYSIKLFVRLTENMKNVIELSLNEHQENAVNKKVGKNVIKLTLKEVDDILKEGEKGLKK